MMNDFVYKLPPIYRQDVKCYKIDLEGYLELEVSVINFVITANTDIKLYSGKLPKNLITCENKKKEKETECFSYDTPLQNVINNNNYNNRASLNEFNINKFQEINSVEQGKEAEDERENSNRINLLDNIQVKIVWFGERAEDAGNVSISCKVQQAKSYREQFKLKTKRKYNQRLKIHNQKTDQIHEHQQLHDKRQYLLLSANNKLRYRICTNGALFLEYLSSCKPIKIILSAGSDGCLATAKPLGQAEFSLPLALLKKFKHNIGKGHNFKYKTKLYTLYNQNKESVLKDLVKTGEIQLRFKMLFAPTVAASASAVAAAQHTNVVMQDKKHLHNHYHQRHNHLRLSNKSSKLAEDIQGDIPKRLTSQIKSEEIVEAMKNLDAKLVAYLAGETDISSKLTNCEVENEVNLNLENNNISNNLEDLLPATKFNIFKKIKAIKLEVEALTLQPEGTKCINLMQNEIEPIFTVECQLSNELIKLVPRHDMYHIMQFESEKFQSLTQCTRFAQKAERVVKLDLNPNWSDENANETVHDFGRVHFTVWWREPGTCLNAMLGMGVLDLNDLYNASLLEQCKRIQIQRRGKHLACLYFKVTLQCDVQKSNTQIKREMFLPKQISVDSDSEKNGTTDKNKNNPVDQQQSAAAAQCGLKSNATTDSSVSGTDKAPAQNNNVKLETTNFEDETSKIRLLKGFISANETKNIEICLPSQTFLICRRFWLEEPASAKSDGSCKFNYQEQFSIINDEKFLQRVDKQFLHLELWQRMSCDDGNGNGKEKAQPLGVARIPLHQFFIAYKDAAITNHLCRGKLPVISIDAWAPFINCQTGLNMGEIKCLLAMGSDEQIRNLKERRGFAVATVTDLKDDIEFINKLQPLQIPTTSKDNGSAKQSTTNTASSVNAASSSTKVKKTSELLDMLQKALLNSSKANDYQSDTVASPSLTTSPAPKYHNETASLPLKPSNVKLFKFSLEIQKAIGLPLNPVLKTKKGYSKRNVSKRFPPNEAPSCYVTFQAEEGQYPTYKSHEGIVFATNIIEKSTQPQWQQRFRLAATTDYLKTPQKLFILKVLKKSSADIAQGRAIATPMEDAIIGLTALDLSAFARGLHIAGSFNIVDFNGRINGQLVVRCHPLDEIVPAVPTGAVAAALPSCSTGSSVDAVIDQFEQTLDLTHLNLGQAIKRKFNELEGISQRLRARLGDVTGNELPKDFNLQSLNAWKPIENEVNDDNELDEFEKDLNTPPLSDDETFEVKIDNQICQGKSETDDVEKSE